MAGSGQHIKPLRLFDLARGAVCTQEESQHLLTCEECSNVLAVFARQFSEKGNPKDKPEDAA